MASDSFTDAPVLTLSDTSFEAEVLMTSSPVLVDVWAPWCGPCRLMAPLMDWVASEYGDRLVVGKLEADANPLTRDQYGIQGLPTLILFRGGGVVARHEGAIAKPQLKAFLDAHL
jgi:thioredoxin 1